MIDSERLNLTPAQTRDFEMIQPFIENGGWFTTTSLAQKLYRSGNYWKKDISKLSNKLSNLYGKTDILERKASRKLYFKGVRKLITTWAYRIKPELIKEYEAQHLKAS